MTPDDIDQILQYHRTGKTFREIATLTGLETCVVADAIEGYAINCSACEGPLETYTAQKMGGMVTAMRCGKCGRER